MLNYEKIAISLRNYILNDAELRHHYREMYHKCVEEDYDLMDALLEDFEEVIYDDLWDRGNRVNMLMSLLSYVVRDSDFRGDLTYLLEEEFKKTGE